MQSPIPDYVVERIRRPAPADSHVVAGSTPVVSFGDARIAKAATLGLNPSRIEFLDDNGQELKDELRRLATHTSLGSSDLLSAPLDTIAQVLEECNGYFKPNRNPYRRWFDPLDKILKACGASYYDGSACHLDLVQWATDPTWGNLRPADLRSRLIEADSPFLVKQLRNENIRLLLVNGMGVKRELEAVIGADFRERPAITGLGHHSTRIFVGIIFERVRVVAWSTNIQSSFGVRRELRERLAERVSELAHDSTVA
ncbi:MAG: hypothetical protein ABSE73_09580 [Planctomycetota bacterium]